MKQRYLKRLTRLLLLIPAAFRTAGKGLPIDRAVRICGARSASELQEDIAAAGQFDVGPSMPEDFLYIEIDNGRVFVDSTLGLTRPPPLSIAEGAMLEASLAPFEGKAGEAVRTALAKIRRAVPDALRDEMRRLVRAVDVRVEPPGDWAAALEEAIERRLEVKIGYRAESTGVAGEKLLEPRALFPREGHWYLAAWSVAKGEEHLYRLDRVTSVELRDRVFAEHVDGSVPRSRGKYVASGAERCVRVRFTGRAATHAKESWPGNVTDSPDGGVTVETQQVPGNFLLGWVLGYGGQAEVESPPEVRAAFIERVNALRAVYSAK